jgi:hypothetical protein
MAMTLRAALAPLAAALLAAGSARAWTGERIVLLVEDGTGNPAAVAAVRPVAEAMLASKGYALVAAPESRAPAGRTGALSTSAARQLAASLRADAVLAITIDFFLDGHARSVGPKANPAAGFTAKLISADGAAVWRNSLGVIAEANPARPSSDGIDALAAKACQRLLWTFPRRNAAGAVAVAEPEWIGDDEPVLAAEARGAAPRPQLNVLLDRRPQSRSGPRFPLLLGRRERPGRGSTPDSPPAVH